MIDIKIIILNSIFSLLISFKAKKFAPAIAGKDK